jgi:GNAT superfamily N-acetyltransferase
MKIRRATIADAHQIAKVHVDCWRTTYKGILSEDFLQSLSYEARAKRWEEIISNSTGGSVFVVESEHGDIVGFANGGKERSGKDPYDGELYAIYLLENYQRQGIGNQLVRHVVQELHRFNIFSLFVWVLEDNPSRFFYY